MTPTAYLDDIARCIVFYGCRRGDRDYRTLIDHIRTRPEYLPAQLRAAGIPCPDWPVVRQGGEHDRLYGRLHQCGEL